MRRPLAFEDVLRLAPVRAPHAEWEEAGDSVQVSVRRIPGALVHLLARLFTLPERKTFTLDRHGARVWKLCDGRTSVAAIADRLGEESGWPADRTREAVLHYLGHLSERRLIGFAEGPAEPAGRPQ